MLFLIDITENTKNIEIYCHDMLNFIAKISPSFPPIHQNVGYPFIPLSGYY